MKVALWLRVSGDEQDTENQRLQLEAEAARRGFEIVKVYNVTASAYAGAHTKILSQVYWDVRNKDYEKCSESSEGVIYIASIHTMMKRIAIAS